MCRVVRACDALGEAIERAEQACDAVAAFDIAHPHMVGEDEQYENAQCRSFMAEFAYR